jgi:hexosaminidase
MSITIKFSWPTLIASFLITACGAANPVRTATPAPTATPGTSTLDFLIPLPVSAQSTGGAFTLTPTTAIYVEPENAEITAIGQYLADKLNPSTGYSLKVLATTGTPSPGNIYLTTTGTQAQTLGEEGYELTITAEGVMLVASQPAGLFRGVQTLRQLLPAPIESSEVQPGPWWMPTGVIRDYPRFVWRGVMLDVARHFFSVEDVKRYIDLAAAYKMNRFHLHLADDQGWRIEIKSWPNLTTHGGSTEVGGGPGGYYTQDEYADIVAYAQARYVTIIPEIDMPGHTNAALASYPELNCNGVAPELYTGTEVGFSSLCIGEEITYKFVDDVIREMAAMTPGPYLHVGGDEAQATKDADYLSFINKVQAIVKSHGKEMIGWEEIAQAEVLPTSIVQHWASDLAATAVKKGLKVIMSPSSKAYLDMKYIPSTPLGLNWAGYIEVQTGYEWDPATQVNGVSESDVLGVEAPLWSETIQNMEDIEFMVFPRLLGYAEIGWSPATGRNWDEYQRRLAAHGPQLTALEVNFYKSPLVEWQ